jgi:hypothetical protein
MKRNWLPNLILLSASTALAVASSEVMVRLLAPQQLVVSYPEIYRPDSIFGWRHRENVDVTVNHGGERPVRFRTDEAGRRIGSDKQRPSDGLRVLLIGDSFVEALAMPAEFTAGPRLERTLSEKLQVPVVVDSIGVGGWNPNHYRLEAESSLSSRQYVLGVVWLYVANDVVSYIATSFPPRQEAQRHRFRIPKNLSRDEWISALAYPVNDMLETRSQLFLFLKQVFEVPLARLGLTAYYFPRVFSKSESGSRRWQITADICASIHEIFEGRNVPVVFVLIPAVYQVEPLLFERYLRAFAIPRDSVDLEQPNRLLAAEFARRRLRLLDALEALRGAHRRGALLYGRIDRHLSAEGHVVLASFLETAMEPLLRQSVAQPGTRDQDRRLQ